MGPPPFEQGCVGHELEPRVLLSDFMAEQLSDSSAPVTHVLIIINLAREGIFDNAGDDGLELATDFFSGREGLRLHGGRKNT